MLTRLILALALLAWPLAGRAHDAHHHDAPDQRLPTIGPAPAFDLTSQDGARVRLEDLRGKAVAVTFIYTNCADTCPLLTAKLVEVQEALGRDFGARVAFVSITVDPERDTPAVLKQYAEAVGADLAGWSFLTGPPAAIGEVTRRYGGFATKAANGEVDHLFLTSLIDPRGRLRVQYLGVRFEPAALQRDLVSLLRYP
jgi:protein SCO1/2